jgi:hypothetical protein
MANSSKKTGQAKPLATPRLRENFAKVQGHIPVKQEKWASWPSWLKMAGITEPIEVAHMAMLAGRNGTIEGRLSTPCGRKGRNH